MAGLSVIRMSREVQGLLVAKVQETERMTRPGLDVADVAGKNPEAAQKQG